jgi:hypothetical protein
MSMPDLASEPWCTSSAAERLVSKASATMSVLEVA